MIGMVSSSENPESGPDESIPSPRHTEQRAHLLLNQSPPESRNPPTHYVPARHCCSGFNPKCSPPVLSTSTRSFKYAHNDSPAVLVVLAVTDGVCESFSQRSHGDFGLVLAGEGIVRNTRPNTEMIT